MKDILIMGIESSCDETSVAIVKNGREVLSNIIDTQISIHKKAVKEAGIEMNQVDAIACTYGPGLVGALLVGVSYAKALSYALNKPLIGVNHIEGHIAANYISHKELEPPFLCLMTSGGNTQIILVEDYTRFKILGKTKDDAIGEAFDKVARVIGLGYPGGPKIDNLAKQGTPNIELPKAHLDNLDFSFSGIKTAVINLNHKNPEINKADLAASFQETVTDMLVEKVQRAIELTNINKIVLAGGVSANTCIRRKFDELAQEKNIKIYYPELKLCTDNGAMIAAAGYNEYIQGKRSDLTLNAVPNLSLKEE